MRYKRYYRHGRLAAFATVCIIITVLIFVLLLDAKLRPAVYELAAVEAHTVLSERINSAVEELLSNSERDYSELVKINYNTNGEITGITADIVKMNLFKSRVSNAIDSRLGENPNATVPVSLGTASGIVLFSGFGPQINVDVGFVSSTQTDFENVFESAGINQTRYSVMLNVETTVMLSFSGRCIRQTVETSFCVAQAVIVGSVPDVMVE